MLENRSSVVCVEMVGAMGLRACERYYGGSCVVWKSAGGSKPRNAVVMPASHPRREKDGMSRILIRIRSRFCQTQHV